MLNFVEIKENFLWMDRRTDAFTDRHLRPALLGRHCRRVDLTIDKKYKNMFACYVGHKINCNGQTCKTVTNANIP